MESTAYTNRDLCGMYFHDRLRVLGDFEESPYFAVTDAELEKMSPASREEFTRRKNEYFTLGRHKGLDGSIEDFAVGGSDVGTIFGVGMNPPSELYEKKRYFSLYAGAPVSPALQELFDTGHLAEPYIRHSFERLTGKKVIPWEVQVVNEKWPHCVANIDGLILEEGNIAIYEGKCPQSFVSQRPWKEIKKMGNCPSAISHVPMGYRLQVWFYLAVYELPYAYICGGGWGFSKEDIGYVRIDRLPAEKENRMMSACEEFVRNTVKGIRPSNVDFADKKKILESFSDIFTERDLLKKKEVLSEKAGRLAHTVISTQKMLSDAQEKLEEEKTRLGIPDMENRITAAKASLAEMIYDRKLAECEFDGERFEISYEYGKRCGFDRKLCEEKYPEVFREVYHEKKTSRTLKISPCGKEGL